MNSLVSLPIVAALPVAAPAMPSTTDRRALEAYASWLFMERRILCGELWPHMGSEAERFDWFDNAGAGWHFRGRGELAWNEGPQPSSRAAAVLDLAGVDWRQPKEDLGLNHQDTGERPALPVGWPQRDGELLVLAEEYIAADAEWGRLNNISDEMDGRRDIPAPELAVIDGDADLKIPEPASGTYGQEEIEKMRAEKWFSVTKTMEADGERFTMAVRYFEPSSAARARADEIIAAYCDWDRRSKRRPNGFRAAKRATDEAMRRYYDLKDRIMGTRATTVAGMTAKARLYQRNGDTGFADSVAEDLFALAGAA